MKNLTVMQEKVLKDYLKDTSDIELQYIMNRIREYEQEEISYESLFRFTPLLNIIRLFRKAKADYPFPPSSVLIEALYKNTKAELAERLRSENNVMKGPGFIRKSVIKGYFEDMSDTELTDDIVKIINYFRIASPDSSLDDIIEIVLKERDERLNKERGKRKKVFISVPFENRNEEAILYSIDKLKAIAKEKFGEELEFIDAYDIYKEYNQDGKIMFKNKHGIYLYYFDYMTKLCGLLYDCDYYIGVSSVNKFNDKESLDNVRINKMVYNHFQSDSIFIIEDSDTVNKVMPDFCYINIRVYDYRNNNALPLFCFNKIRYPYIKFDKKFIEKTLLYRHKDFATPCYKSMDCFIELDFRDTGNCKLETVTFRLGGVINNYGDISIDGYIDLVKFGYGDICSENEPTKKKRKVFISVPFSGRSDEDILDSINKMHKLAEIKFNEPLEPVHNFFIKGDDNEIIAPVDANQSIYYLSEAIKKMSQVDYFIGVPYIGSRGCDIEFKIAKNYDIPAEIISSSDLHDILPDWEFNKKED